MGRSPTVSKTAAYTIPPHCDSHMVPGEGVAPPELSRACDLQSPPALYWNNLGAKLASGAGLAPASPDSKSGVLLLDDPENHSAIARE